MSDESFALSTVLPPLATEGDYDAICATVMESARGRWFLQEYAKRNRNADTVQVLAAIERIETVIRGERGRDAYESFRGELAEMAKTIAAARAEDADIRPQAAAGGTAPTKANAADILAAAERLQDVAWTMRERGLDPATCDQIEAITAAIQKASAVRGPDERRAQKLGEALQCLERRIHAMLETVTSAPAAVQPTPEAAPVATMDAAGPAPADDHAAGVTPEAASAPQEPAVHAHAAGAPAEAGGLELEPLVVMPAAFAVEDTPEPAHELEHAPLAVEPLFETPMEPIADRPGAAGAQHEPAAEAADVMAAASTDAASGLPGATEAAIEPVFPDEMQAPLHPPAPDFTVLEPPPLAETMVAAAADPAAASEATNPFTNSATVEHAAQSVDEFAEEHALVVVERGVPDEAVPASQAESDLVVAAARATGDASDGKRLEPARAAAPAIAERAPADEQMRFDDWTRFAQELHAAGIKTQIPEDESAPSAAAQAAAADAAAPEAAASDQPQPMTDGVAPNPETPVAVQPFVGFPRPPLVLPEQDAKPPSERDILVSAWEAAIVRPIEEAIAPQPKPSDAPSATNPFPQAGPPAEPAAFLLEPAPMPAAPIEPTASAAANDEITELEAELFAPATPAAEPTTPAVSAAASRADAAAPPLPQVTEAQPPVRPPATPMPQPAPNDPLAALKAMSDEERIALFT
jgi:hypothetical protein